MTTPRYLTPRTSSFTTGRKIAAVSEAIGRPLMPWQISAAELIGETDKFGQLIHPVVVVTVPRQSGKTALMAAVMLHRLMAQPLARVWYTAQTGIKAREQLTELMEVVEHSPLRSILKCRRGASDTSITLSGNGSRCRAHPPKGDSLHGNQSDLNIIDEGWAFSEADAAMLMGAITPTQAARKNPQTIIVSTAGTAASTWFHGLIDRGRAGELCLIDYGIGPEVSPDDDAAIAAAHPAIGHTQKIDVLAAARPQLSVGEFVRAYGNRPTATYDRLIPIEITEQAATSDVLPAGPVGFGAAVSFERDDAAVAACVIAPDGTPWVEVIDTRPSSAALGEVLASIIAAHGGHVMIDGTGPGQSVADTAERDGATVTRVTGTDMSAATGDLLDRLRRPLEGEPPGVKLRVHPAISAAFDVATLRTVGDRQIFARRTADGSSVAVLEAIALAIRAAHHLPTPATPPMIWSN